MGPRREMLSLFDVRRGKGNSSRLHVVSTAGGESQVLDDEDEERSD